MLQEQKSRSKFDEDEKRPFQMTDTDVVSIFATFNPIGHWRHDLETGHTYCCKTMLEFFGMPRCEGPVDMMEIASHLHPDELSLVMEAHESASVVPLNYQKVHRIRKNDMAYRWYCSTGRYRPKPGTKGEIIGITWEVPPQRCEAIQQRMDEN